MVRNILGSIDVRTIKYGDVEPRAEKSVYQLSSTESFRAHNGGKQRADAQNSRTTGPCFSSNLVVVQVVWPPDTTGVVASLIARLPFEQPNSRIACTIRPAAFPSP